MFIETFKLAGSASLIFTGELENKVPWQQRAKSVEIRREEMQGIPSHAMTKRAKKNLKYKVLCANQEFFSILPNFNVKEKDKTSMFKQGKKIMQRNSTIKAMLGDISIGGKLDQDRDIQMSDKIYLPFMISYSMVLQFQDHPEDEMLSIKDIMKTFVSSQQSPGKFYFKVFQLQSDD